MKNLARRLRRRALNGTNALLHRFGVQLVPDRAEKPWDEEFAGWITEAKASGLDPNDVGDREWRGKALENARRHLLPRIYVPTIARTARPR